MGIRLVILKDWLLWMYWHPFRKLMQWVPYRLAYGVGKLVGKMWFRISGRKRRELVDACRRLCPSVSHIHIDEVVKRSCINRWLDEIDMMRYPIMDSSHIDRYVRCMSLEILDRALVRGRGVILLFAHFGSNQMVMPAIGYHGYRMCQMSAPPTVWTEKMPDRRFSAMEKASLKYRWNQETSLPVTHINIFGTLRGAVSCLKNGHILGIAIDGGGGKERLPVELVGKPALLSTGPATLAIRTGSTILPVFMVRDETGLNHMSIHSELRVPEGKSEPAAVRHITQAFADLMTEYIRRYPDHYLHFPALRQWMTRYGDPPLFVEKD